MLFCENETRSFFTNRQISFGKPGNPLFTCGILVATSNKIPTWEMLTDYLQADIKPKHLRAVDVAGAIKKIKQRPGQTVSDLIVKLTSLESQLLEPPTESVMHSNLLYALHDCLRKSLVSKGCLGTARGLLEEEALTQEQTETFEFDNVFNGSGSPCPRDLARRCLQRIFHHQEPHPAWTAQFDCHQRFPHDRLKTSRTRLKDQATSWQSDE